MGDHLRVKRVTTAGACSSRQVATLVLIAVLLLFAPYRGFAAKGDLDPSFGNGGKVTTDFGGTSDQANAIAIQSDGRIVAAGFSLDTIAGSRFSMARYKTDGQPDLTFGVLGKTSTANIHHGNAIAIQTNGKIVIAGADNTLSTGFDFVAARYNTDGSPDLNFGMGGKVITDFFGLFDEALDIAIQTDGKIILAGLARTSVLNNTSFDFALLRLNADGSPDMGFGTGGKLSTDFEGLRDEAHALAIQPNGKIVAAGVGSRVATGFDFALARYNNDGSLDTSFGAGGKAITDFFGFLDEAFDVSLQSDGRLVAAGYATSLISSDSDFALVRYHTNGSIDGGFGTGGKVTTTIGGVRDRANALAIHGDGRIIAAGTSGDVGQIFDFALAQYQSNGSPDLSFGTNGTVTTPFGGTFDGAFDVAIQTDQKVVAAGVGNGDFALARYDDSGFDFCLQDDSSGTILRINLTTGAYEFTNCSGLTLIGTGVLIRRGNTINLQHNAPDRRVLATIDNGVGRGTATIQLLMQGLTFGIMDRNTFNNTCLCR